MHPYHRTKYAFFACAIAAAGSLAHAAQPAAAAPPLDRHGDALPDGATLRIGTTRLRSSNLAGVAFSPDGKLIASTGWEPVIRLWDAQTGQLVQRLVLDDHDEATFAVAFSPDGAAIASVGERGIVRLWDLKTGDTVFSKLGHVDQTFGARVYGVAFAPDGLTFATAGDDNSIRLWDAVTGE